MENKTKKKEKLNEAKQNLKKVNELEKSLNHMS